jgi:hypothetical protein
MVGPKKDRLRVNRSFGDKRFQMVNGMSESPNVMTQSGNMSGPVDGAPIPGAAPGKALSPAAIRALEEAEARRKASPTPDLPAEINGPAGQEPTRFGDWERKGLAVDF